jgi:hypothetical protein
MSHTIYVHLSPGDSPSSLGLGKACRVVLVSEASTSPSFREAVAEKLVNGNCLYFMSWGAECEAWHDEVDMANIEKFDFNEIPEDAFVMTTWHEGEPLSEVLWFCKHNAFHPTVDLKATLLLHLAPHPNEQGLLQAYADA